jgi:hypothetical protein
MKIISQDGHTITEEDLAKILRDGYEEMIVEADEWRPLAKYIMAMMAMAANRKNRIEE